MLIIYHIFYTRMTIMNMNMNVRNLCSLRAKKSAIHNIISKSLPILLSKNNLAAHVDWVVGWINPSYGKWLGSPITLSMCSWDKTNSIVFLVLQIWAFLSHLEGIFAPPDHHQITISLLLTCAFLLSLLLEHDTPVKATTFMHHSTDDINTQNDRDVYIVQCLQETENKQLTSKATSTFMQTKEI